jgi:hypothetical protein
MTLPELSIIKGKIELGPQRLSRGTQFMDQRLLIDGRPKLKGDQGQHLIADGVARSNPLMLELLKRGEFDIDHAENLLGMPSYRSKSWPETTVGHQGPHDKYDSVLRRSLDLKLQDLTEDGKRSLGSLSTSQLKQAMKEVQADMQGKIKRGEVSTRDGAWQGDPRRVLSSLTPPLVAGGAKLIQDGEQHDEQRH